MARRRRPRARRPPAARSAPRSRLDAEPPAQIRVLAVHEEALVPARRAARVPRGGRACKRLRPSRPSRRCVYASSVANQLVRPIGARKEPVQEQRLRVGRAEARESPLREVEASRRSSADRGATAPTDASRSSTRHELRRAMRVDARIRVQKEHVGRRACVPADVAAVREAAVLIDWNGVDLKVLHDLETPVGRGVVHDDHVHAVGNRRAARRILGARRDCCTTRRRRQRLPHHERN